MTPLELAETALACDALETRVRELRAIATRDLSAALSLGGDRVVSVSGVPWRVRDGYVETQESLFGDPPLWMPHGYKNSIARRSDVGVALVFGDVIPCTDRGACRR
jgi:hypothetical protein